MEQAEQTLTEQVNKRAGKELYGNEKEHEQRQRRNPLQKWSAQVDGKQFTDMEQFIFMKEIDAEGTGRYLVYQAAAKMEPLKEVKQAESHQQHEKGVTHTVTRSMVEQIVEMFIMYAVCHKLPRNDKEKPKAQQKLTGVFFQQILRPVELEISGEQKDIGNPENIADDGCVFCCLRNTQVKKDKGCQEQDKPLILFFRESCQQFVVHWKQQPEKEVGRNKPVAVCPEGAEQGVKF